MRRLQPRDATALLIDQHRRFGPLNRVAQIIDEARKLTRVDAVSSKQDEPGGICLSKEAGLAIGKLGSGTSKHDGELVFSHGDFFAVEGASDGPPHTYQLPARR